MDIPHCPSCYMQLRAHDRDEISLEAAGESYHEKQNCCPYCHSVLSIEVTMAEDEDSPTLSKLRAVVL
jgi:hypothetical protein